MKPDVSLMRERPAVELDPVRTFPPKMRVAIFKRAKGRCELCGEKIIGKWIAGHVIPHSIGGATTLENARVECELCAKETHSEDTDTAARCKRQAGLKGQQARRAKNGPRMKSRGFDKTLRKKLNGTVVKR